MRGFLCGTSAKTNEEYKKVVKIRMNRFLALGFVGLITLTVALLVKFYWDLEIKEEMLGVYTGAGTGILLVSIILWVKNKLMLGNEDKLKESRLSNMDERIQEISNRAFRVASIIMLVVMYAIALIGGLFYPVLVQMLLAIISVFVLVYLVAYRFYNNRM